MPKYINYLGPDGLEYPIIFPETLKHSEVNRMVTGIYPGFKAKSAGFIRLFVNDENKIKADPYGASVSLGIQSSQDDIWALERTIDN